MTAQVLRGERAPIVLFAALAIAVYSVAVILSQRLSTLEGADVLAIAMTLDMLVVVPAAFYLLVARRRGLSPLSLVPVVVAGLLLARAILPAAHHAPLRVAEILLLPVELLVLTWIARRAARGIRAARRDTASDPLARLRQAAEEVAGSVRVANVLVTELAVGYYLFTRTAPHVPRGARSFTHHVQSGHGGVVAAFTFLLVVEGLVVHVIAQRWSEVLAWLLTAGTIYGALWLIADYRASVRRPLLVTDRDLIVRAGLRHDARVPLASIRDVVVDEPPEDAVKVTLLGAPSHWIRLRTPVRVEGPYGLSKTVTAIGVQPDDAPAFLEALAPR